jgi:hypothetical protein
MTTDAPDGAAERRVLVVADRTPAAQVLLDLLQAQAAAQPCRFFVLVPEAGHPDDPDWDVDTAADLVHRATRGPAEGLTGGSDPLVAVQTALTDHDIDEIVVCTRATHLTRWVHHDLPSRLRHLDVPVTVVAPDEASPAAAPGLGGPTQF